MNVEPDFRTFAHHRNAATNVHIGRTPDIVYGFVVVPFRHCWGSCCGWIVVIVEPGFRTFVHDRDEAFDKHFGCMES